ncbi:MAG: hypothetical protein ACRYF9_11095 [Janthinobacterium lividum]
MPSMTISARAPPYVGTSSQGHRLHVGDGLWVGLPEEGCRVLQR